MFTGYLATLNTAALMPEALMASIFLPDLYTTLPVERTETALPPTEPVSYTHLRAHETGT